MLDSSRRGTRVLEVCNVTVSKLEESNVYAANSSLRITQNLAKKILGGFLAVSRTLEPWASVDGTARSSRFYLGVSTLPILDFALLNSA